MNLSVMKSVNFEFLRDAWPQLAELGGFAEAYVHSDPQSALAKMRIFAEQMTLGLYKILKFNYPPRPDLLDLLNGSEFREIVPRVVLDKLHTIRIQGNKAAHGETPRASAALTLLKELFDVARWLFVSQGGGTVDQLPAYKAPSPVAPADETKGRLQREKRDALQKLAAHEARLEALLKELTAEREARQVADAEAAHLKQQLETRGVAAVAELQFDEETTRRRLVDLQLTAVGWDVGANGASTEDVGQEVEVDHQPTPTGKGAADYVLWNDDGKPLAVIEAKKTAHDADKGKTQARLYADGLEKTHRQRPVIFYTNGPDIWIWDDAQDYPPRKLFGFYSKDSLQLLHFQRANKQPLDTLSPKADIVDRLYQINAIKRVTERFTEKRRKALIVQATGTGKTRVAIALADLLERAQWAKRILFLCDRRELRKQAKDAFTEHTAHTPMIVRASTARERQHRIYLATYPAMLKVHQTFDPGFFDLIIADESHRSIYNIYRDLFRWFDALQVGLTATPVEMVSRSTCGLFDCDFRTPTFNYDYERAVEEKFVVPFEVYTHTTQFHREGIRRDNLSDEQIAELEDQGVDPNTLDFDAAEVDRVIYNKDTNRKVLRNLMEHGIRDASGQEIGKTIVFARNHQHAILLRDLFDELYPQYGGKFCQVIDNYDPRAEILIDEFKDPTNILTVAISVDMLDTGIDVEEVVNLVFAKPVRSRVKFWQMIGRGTRLCPNLFGPGKHKGVFRIFDHWGNFEYWGRAVREAEITTAKGLVQLLFEARLDLAETALQKGDLDTFRSTVELIRQDINALPEESISVRERWREKRRLADKATLEQFAPATVQALRDDIAPLMQWRPVRGLSEAYDFDLLIAKAQKALLEQSAAFDDLKGDLLNRVAALPMHLNQVREKVGVINDVKAPSFWTPDAITPAALETMRTELRGLMRYLPSTAGPALQPRVIDVTEDESQIRFARRSSRLPANELAAYRAQVEQALRELFDTNPTLRKIRRGAPVTEADLKALTSLVLTQHPDLDLAVLKEFYADTAEPLDQILRGIVGMEADAVRERFTAFAIKHPKLTAKQQQFLQLLQNHVARFGSIELDKLYEAPFTQVHADGLDGVFPEAAIADELVEIVRTFEPQRSQSPAGEA